MVIYFSSTQKLIENKIQISCMQFLTHTSKQSMFTNNALLLDFKIFY